MKKRAIVFIDGNNWYHNSKKVIDKPSKINLSKLVRFICLKFDLELIEIRYYNSIPDISDGKEVYYKHQEFLSRLKASGIIVKTRKLKKVSKKDIKIEKGIDVKIAVDMIDKCLLKIECDCCILVSGDADFIPAMQIIKDNKKEAITASVIKGYSRELLQGRFRYLILKKKDLEDLSK